MTQTIGGVSSPEGTMRPGGSVPRSLAATFRRHGLALIAVFALFSSLVLLASPWIKRSYDVAGTLTVNLRAAPPDLARLPESVLQELQPQASRQEVTIIDAGQPAGATSQSREIRFSTQNADHNTGRRKLQNAAANFQALLQSKAAALAGEYRASLQKALDQAQAREKDVDGEVQEFRLSHRGALPDDPTSILAQFDKLAGRLDEREQRLHVVSEQISRLQEYKTSGHKKPDAPAAPAGAPAAVPADGDPEVQMLAAQLQLIGDQIDEQLGTMHRTEQHPYVVDLRNQQATLQKKLEAAKQRAAAGQPPSATVKLPGGHNDTAALASQALDLQIANLQAERDALESEVTGLRKDRAAMQTQVDGVLPIRTAYEKLTERQAAARKDRQTAEQQLADFDRPAGIADGQAMPAVEVSAFALSKDSPLPGYPRLWALYVLAVGAGLAGVLGATWLIQVTDRSLHTPREAALALDTPILGVVSEIRSPRQQRRARIWRIAGRPAAAVILACGMAGSAWWCQHELANPQFGHAQQQIGVMTPAAMDR